MTNIEYFRVLLYPLNISGDKHGAKPALPVEVSTSNADFTTNANCPLFSHIAKFLLVD